MYLHWLTLLLFFIKSFANEINEPLLTCEKVVPLLKKNNLDIESCEDRFGSPIIKYGPKSRAEHWTCHTIIDRLKKNLRLPCQNVGRCQERSD